MRIYSNHLRTENLDKTFEKHLRNVSQYLNSKGKVNSSKAKKMRTKSNKALAILNHYFNNSSETTKYLIVETYHEELLDAILKCDYSKYSNLVNLVTL